jgi:hypothetical protein
MASDDHVAAALTVFAKEIMRSSLTHLGNDEVFSGHDRQRRLLELARKIEEMAANPRAATYQAFEGILKQAQELGAQVERETIIQVASAFMQRPHVSSATR